MHLSRFIAPRAIALHVAELSGASFSTVQKSLIEVNAGWIVDTKKLARCVLVALAASRRLVPINQTAALARKLDATGATTLFEKRFNDAMISIEWLMSAQVTIDSNGNYLELWEEDERPGCAAVGVVKFRSTNEKPNGHAAAIDGKEVACLMLRLQELNDEAAEDAARVS